MAEKLFKWIRKRRCNKVETLGWMPQEGQRLWGWFYDASERSPDGPVAPFYVWVLLPILPINLHEEQNLSHSPSMSITPPTVNIEALKPDESWELVQAKCCQDVLWKGLVCSVKLGETDVWKIKLLSYILGFFQGDFLLCTVVNQHKHHRLEEYAVSFSKHLKQIQV